MNAPATVYLVTNRINGDTYIGVTRFGIHRRWTQHKYTSSTCPKTYLHHAIAKYGKDNFFISEVISCLRIEYAKELEQQAIKQFKPVYNQTNGGEVTVGRRIPEEVKQRIIKANTGKKRTPEQNLRMSELKKQLYIDNPVFRNAAVERITAARLLVNEVKRIAAVKKSHESRVWSVESKAKLSASCIGRRYGKEIIDKSRIKKQKAVECIDLNCVFDSVLEAAEMTGVHFSSISRVCLGKRTKAGGMKFQFAQGEYHQ
jgi:group I intron endonuclease